MNNFYVEYIFTKFVRVSSSVFFFSKSREIWFFHPPIYIDLYDCKIVCVLIESRYVERNNRKRISINKSHVHNFNFLEFYNFSLSVYLVKFVKLQIYIFIFYHDSSKTSKASLYLHISWILRYFSPIIQAFNNLLKSYLHYLHLEIHSIFLCHYFLHQLSKRLKLNWREETIEVTIEK